MNQAIISLVVLDNFILYGICTNPDLRLGSFSLKKSSFKLLIKKAGVELCPEYSRLGLKARQYGIGNGNGSLVDSHQS